jgi:hypothetical protein
LSRSEYKGGDARSTQGLELERTMADPLIAHEHDPALSPCQTQPFRIRRPEGDVNTRTSDLPACLLEGLGENA